MPIALATDAQVVPNPRTKLFWRTLINLRTSFVWAWLDTKCQYRRSKVGPLWETVNVAVMIAAISLVSSGLFGAKMEDLIGYIGLGLIIWSAIAGLVADGCGTFVRNAGHILGSNISVDLYVGRTLFRTFITFGHHVLLYLVGVALGLVPLTWIALLSIPGIALLLVNGFWVIIVLAFMCARFRDVELIVRNLLQVAFLVTPVFWNFQQISPNQRFMVDFNPLFHFIQIIRLPLLGEIPTARTCLVVIATTLLGYAAAAVVYYRMRRRLAFFV